MAKKPAKPRFYLPPVLEKCKRGGPAVILPKDAGIVFAVTGIGKSSSVVELGTGSGFMTIMLANIAREVTTYERKKEFAELAEKNLKIAGIKNVRIVPADVYEGFEGKNADLVFCDIPEAERIVENAFKVLKKDGFLVCYCPNIEQAKCVTLKAKEVFSDIFVLESILRDYEVREHGTRPKHFGLFHTAYLVFSRK